MVVPSSSEQSTLAALWRVRSYLRPYTGHMVTMIIAALLSELSPVVIPLLMQRVIDGPIRHGNRGALLPLSLLALAFGAAQAVAILVRRWVMTSSALGAETTLRHDLYTHLQRLPVAFHDRWQSGQLLSRATSDLSTIRRFLGFGLVFMIVNTVVFIVVEIMLLAAYWPLGLLVGVSSIPMAFATMKFERRYNAASRRSQDLNGELTTNVEEAAGGIRTIKAFGRRPLMLTRFTAGATALRDAELVKVRVLALFWAVLEVHPQVVLALITLFGSVAVVHGELTLGGLVAFIALFLRLVMPISSLGWILALAQEADTAAERVYEVLDTRPDVVDSPRPRRLPSVTGRLRFERVGFTYPGASGPVLRDIDLEIEPGETVAVVGATGSGKTTLTALAPRLYDVTTGRITLDGVDIRDLPLAQLRTMMATAFEDPTLFSASVRENLTLGRPTASDTEITEAIRVAQAGFVHDLPWGLDTGSASRASPCPAASGNGWRWPGRYSGARGCWYSTTRCPRWTSTRRRWWSRHCTRYSPGRPRWPWRTAPQPCCWPTGSRSCRTEPCSRSASIQNCSRPCPPTEICWRATPTWPRPARWRRRR